MSLARPPKESHLDTIYYEMDLLRFCSEHLRGMSSDALSTTQGRLTSYVFLESFLAHYRNLVRFFSGERHGKDDLSTYKPETWTGRPVSAFESAEIESTVRDPARNLEHWYGTISKYLQHCTALRSAKDVAWNIDAMMAELEPIIDSFVRLFPHSRAN